MSLAVNFMEDNDNIVSNIKSSVSGQSILVIFDDPACPGLIISWVYKNQKLICTPSQHLHRLAILKMQVYWIANRGCQIANRGCWLAEMECLSSCQKQGFL